MSHRRELNYLFSDGDLLDLLEQIRQSALRQVETISPSVVLNSPAEELVSGIVAAGSLELPVIHKDAISLSPARETTIDVTGNPCTDPAGEANPL